MYKVPDAKEDAAASLAKTGTDVDLNTGVVKYPVPELYNNDPLVAIVPDPSINTTPPDDSPVGTDVRSGIPMVVVPAL